MADASTTQMFQEGMTSYVGGSLVNDDDDYALEANTELEEPEDYEPFDPTEDELVDDCLNYGGDLDVGAAGG